MMKKIKSVMQRESTFAYTLLAPGVILMALLIGYPMIYNIVLSFQEVPLNPLKSSDFVGFNNYLSVLRDETFYQSLGITILFTLIVTAFSTILGLLAALFLNRPFKGKKLVNAIVISSYVIPVISLVYAWRYALNPIYGIVNYISVNVLHIFDTVPLWFDDKVLSFVLVCVFCIWKYFPYSYISFLAILQSIDRSLYEVSELDGANYWQQFKAITLPAIMPVLSTTVSLRAIWLFYAYSEVVLLTSQVNVLGAYLYEEAFSIHDFGAASAISVLLFLIIFPAIIVFRKKVLKNA